MSLIDNMMCECIIMNATKRADPAGGTFTEWSEGDTIKAAIVNDQSMQSRVAEKEGVTSVYTITTHKDVVLEFHNVIKRKSDGKIFRVTSDADDKVAPAVSTLDIRQVTAEKWALPQ